MLRRVIFLIQFCNVNDVIMWIYFLIISEHFIAALHFLTVSLFPHCFQEFLRRHRDSLRYLWIFFRMNANSITIFSSITTQKFVITAKFITRSFSIIPKRFLLTGKLITRSFHIKTKKFLIFAKFIIRFSSIRTERTLIIANFIIRLSFITTER